MKEYRNLIEKKYKNKKFLYFYLDKCTNYYYNKYRYGEVAQLARAFGSYPKGHVFESHLRYQTKNCSKNGQFFYECVQLGVTVHYLTILLIPKSYKYLFLGQIIK